MDSAIASVYYSLPAYNSRQAAYYDAKLYDYQEAVRIQQKYVRTKETEEILLYAYIKHNKQLRMEQNNLGRNIDVMA